MHFMMLNYVPVTDLIDKRYSCRSYDATPIAAETRQRLIDCSTNGMPVPSERK